MMFLKIIPAFRRGADTPVETGAPELLRIDLIRRVCPVTLAGGFECVQLNLEGGQTVHCTGTIADFVAALDSPPEVFTEPKPEPDLQTTEDPDTDLE